MIISFFKKFFQRIIIYKRQWPFFILYIGIIIVFTFNFVNQGNYEFLIYTGIMLLFLMILLYTNITVNYSNKFLFWFTFWMFLHTSGGGLSINNRRLYEYIIFPLSGEPYNIFRFDQLVHMLGTFIATIVVFYLLRPLLKEIMYRQAALVLVIIMAGVGVGSINELIEFIVTVFIPDNGVGGYENTVIDMGANLIGAMLASIYILIKERNYVFHKQIGKDKNNQNLKNKKN